MPSIRKIAFGTGAAAAGLGAFGLQKTAELLRALAGDSGRGGENKVPVERKGAASRTVEPLIPPERTPENPAAPAGADPDGSSGTGPVPRRISNPKAARKVRRREQKAAAPRVSRLEVAKGEAKGGRPGSAKAENTPSERTAKRAGRQAAPMGSKDSAEPS